MTTLLKKYEAQSLLCNISICAATTQPGLEAFRGDLVLIEGDIADASGRRMPPRAVVKQAIVLTDRDRISFAAGTLNELSLLPVFVERYRTEFSSDIRVLFYIENLSKPLITELDGVAYVLVPHTDGGAVWNTLMDDLRLDKDDFKGQSAEDKVITVAKAVRDFKPKFAQVSFDDALVFTVEIKREARGPI